MIIQYIYRGFGLNLDGFSILPLKEVALLSLYTSSLNSQWVASSFVIFSETDTYRYMNCGNNESHKWIYFIYNFCIIILYHVFFVRRYEGRFKFLQIKLYIL